MLTLQNKLYESLLDDEEELVNNNRQFVEDWAKTMAMKFENNNSFNAKLNETNLYTERSGKIFTSEMDPEYMEYEDDSTERPYKLSIDTILPPHIDFGNIYRLFLELDRINYTCPDILTNSGLKKLSKYPIESLHLLYNTADLKKLDFNLVGNPNMKSMTIQIPYCPGFVSYIHHWPKFKLESLFIDARHHPVVLDNIKGLNCDNFTVCGIRINEDSLDRLIDDSYNAATATLNNTEENIIVLDRFFSRNNVKNLIYLRRFKSKTTKYLIDKKKSGGYKLTRLK